MQRYWFTSQLVMVMVEVRDVSITVVEIDYVRLAAAFSDTARKYPITRRHIAGMHVVNAKFWRRKKLHRPLCWHALAPKSNFDWTQLYRVWWPLKCNQNPFRNVGATFTKLIQVNVHATVWTYMSRDSLPWRRLTYELAWTVNSSHTDK